MPKKILVVDDEAPILNILKFNLTKAGYVVATAVDGEEALAKMRSERPDLVLCDVMMPKKTGFEVLDEAKGDAALKGVPFVILTAKGQKADEERGMGAGADRYLTKPFSPRIVIQTVKELLGE